MDQMMTSSDVLDLTLYRQLEVDQKIIANNPYYAHTSTTGSPLSDNEVGRNGMNTNIETKSTIISLTTSVSNVPPLLSTTASYQPSYAPQSMTQLQSPVNKFKQEPKIPKKILK